MADSESISRSFYDRLGMRRLASRTTPAWDREIVARLMAMLLPGQRILDVGCGYGRTAIPLALAGFEVIALDISDVLLAAARAEAERCGARLTWLRESMCRIPLPDHSVDVVLSLWSAFHELLHHDEQLGAIREMHRVLRPGGWALIEGPIYREATDEEIKAGVRHGPGKRLSLDIVEGLENPHFRHDPSTLDSLMAEAEVPKHDTYIDDWAGRPRQFLRFEREARAT